MSDPIHLAADSEDIPQLKVLLKKKETNVNAEDSNGWTALHSACHQVSYNAIKLLGKHKHIRINATNQDGNTPLHYLARSSGEDKNRYVQCMKLLVDNGANLNITNVQGDTPLHQAVARTNIEGIVALLCFGADYKKQNGQNETCLDTAKLKEDQAASRLLAAVDSEGKESNNWEYGLSSEKFFEVIKGLDCCAELRKLLRAAQKISKEERMWNFLTHVYSVSTEENESKTNANNVKKMIISNYELFHKEDQRRDEYFGNVIKSEKSPRRKKPPHVEAKKKDRKVGGASSISLSEALKSEPLNLECCIVKPQMAKIFSSSSGTTAHAYVVVTNDFNNQAFKTKVANKTLNPSWNDEMRIFFPPSTGQIYVSMWDKEKFWTSDDLLGEITINISELKVGEPGKWWTFPSEKKSKKKDKDARPQIFLEIALIEAAPYEEETRQTADRKKSKHISPRGSSLEDNYEVGEELGRGGFSVVQLATHKISKEKYAVKVIKKHGLGEDDLGSLHREIEILMKLSHPNIIQLVETFETDFYLYLVLELVEGGELFDEISRRGFYSERDAADLISQMLSAMEYMHKMGVAHRDLKPENLLVGKQGGSGTIIKISDFGLAKDFAGTAVLETAVGTPGYFAPEVLQGKPYDCAVDVWSMGVIAYILLSGFLPFYNDNTQVLFDQIIAGDYSFPSPEWDFVSEDAKDFIRKIIITNPAGRYTAQQCANHPFIVENLKPENKSKILKAGQSTIRLRKGLKL